MGEGPLETFSVRLTKDQIEFLRKMSPKASNWVREAIDEKRIQESKIVSEAKKVILIHRRIRGLEGRIRAIKESGDYNHVKEKSEAMQDPMHSADKERLTHFIEALEKLMDEGLDRVELKQPRRIVQFNVKGDLEYACFDPEKDRWDRETLVWKTPYYTTRKSIVERRLKEYKYQLNLLMEKEPEPGDLKAYEAYQVEIAALEKEIEDLRNKLEKM